MGSFTPTGDVDIYGNIEYSDKDFAIFSDKELFEMEDVYAFTYTLEAKAFRLELAERALAKWRKANGG